MPEPATELIGEGLTDSLDIIKAIAVRLGYTFIELDGGNVVKMFRPDGSLAMMATRKRASAQ